MLCPMLHSGQRHTKLKGITDAAGLFRGKFPRILHIPLFLRLAVLAATCGAYKMYHHISEYTDS
jgi:hypothetical protein